MRCECSCIVNQQGKPAKESRNAPPWIPGHIPDKKHSLLGYWYLRSIFPECQYLNIISHLSVFTHTHRHTWKKQKLLSAWLHPDLNIDCLRHCARTASWVSIEEDKARSKSKGIIVIVIVIGIIHSFKSVICRMGRIPYIHRPMTEHCGFRLKCFSKRWVLSWHLNVLSFSESKFDVSSNGRLLQTAAQEWLKAWCPKGGRLWLTCSQEKSKSHRAWSRDLVQNFVQCT